MAGSMELDLEEEEQAWWQELGYLAGKPVLEMTTVPDPGDPENYFVEEPRPTGWWICVAEMIYTYRVMLCTPDYVGEHYCYPKEDLDLALKAWAIWDGRNGEEVPNGYTRHHK